MNHSPSKKTSRRWLKPWKNLGWGRRILRIVWVSVAGLWLLTVLQVLLGIVFNPPLTPLMVQRFFQQLADDELFLYHHGFDVKQMKIAHEENKSGRRFRGGSTISQQTAKNAFLPHTRSMFRKAVEAYYTMMIETFWSKRRIMEVYLNIIEFGDGIYGAEAASQHYFGHSAKTLSRNEAAQLAATLPAPLKRNPSHSSPYFRRRTSDIKGRFGWGKVDLENPDPKKEKRYEDQESLWDFMKWYYEKR